MSVIVGFMLLLMVSFLAYMAYRLYKRRRLPILLSLCAQLAACTMAAAGFVENVNINMSNTIQAVYISFGIVLPAVFFIYDYFNMVGRVKKHGAYDGFVEELPMDAEGKQLLDINRKRLNPPMPEIGPSEILNNIGPDWEETGRNLKKFIAQSEETVRSGNFKYAADAYGMLVKIIKNNSGLFYNHGTFCFKNGMYQEAAASLRKAVELADRKGGSESREMPEARHMAYYNLGNAQFMLGKYEQALVSFKKATEGKDDFHEAVENAARCLIGMGRRDEAAEYYKRLCRTYEKSFRMHFTTGKLLADLGKWDDALAELQESLRLKKDFPEGLQELARVNTAMEKYDKAVENYMKLSRLCPDSAAVFYNLGVSLYRTGGFERAVEAFEKSVKLDGSDYKAFYNMAAALAELERHDEAQEALRHVIELNDRFEEAYNNLGISLSDNGRNMEALEIYKKGLEKNAGSFSLHYNAGVCLAECGMYEEATEAFNSALDIRPDACEVCYHLGAALMELKKYNEALEVYKTALKIKPDDGEMYYGLAAVYSLLKRNGIAMDTLRKAVELDESYKSQAKGDKAFDPVRGNPEFKKVVGY